MKKLLYILPVSSQPRLIRRVNEGLLKSKNVTVAYFERDYFKKNKLPENIKKVNLGYIENGKYYTRFIKLISIFRTVKKLIKEHDVVYLFSPEVLILLLFISKPVSLIYEIGDIRKFSSFVFFERVYSIIYKLGLKKCDLIYVTSYGFKKYLHDKFFIDINKIIIKENKLNKTVFSPTDRIVKKSAPKKRLVIGIIGLFRYRCIIDFLEAHKHIENNIEISLFGDGPMMTEIKNFLCKGKVHYYGQFENPIDLRKIYEKIDVSFTMYDNNDLNVRLALPNKLYESMYFNTPIIVSEKTYLAEMVDKYNIGIVWNPNDMKGLIQKLNNNNVWKKIIGFQKNCLKIEAKTFLND